MKSTSHRVIYQSSGGAIARQPTRPAPWAGLLSCLAACIGPLVVACGTNDDAAAPTGQQVPMFGQPGPAPEAPQQPVMSPPPAPAVASPPPAQEMMSPPPAASGEPDVSEEQAPNALPIEPMAEGTDSMGTDPMGTDPTTPPQGEAEPPPAGGAGGAPPNIEEPTPPGELPPITVWIAGDSTVANGNTPCPRGWGGAFAPHFDDRVTVRNSAVGGRSVHTWLYNVQTVMDETGECALTRDASGEPVLQARWQEMLENMQAGDYLFIQFGINDGSPTCDRHVGIEAFKAAYGMMAIAARERGAHPVFITPVSSIACDGAEARGSRGGFVPATLEIGSELSVPVIDLHAQSVELFQSLAFCPVAGGDVSAATTGAVGDFFCDDHTHFSSQGAVEIAELVVEALRQRSLPLSAYLR